MDREFSFPPLTPTELVSSLADINIHVTEEELRKPTRELAHQLFGYFAESFLQGVELEQIHGSLQSEDLLEYPELYEEALPQTNFERKLFQVFSMSGVDDFSSRDLEPTRSKRFCFLLSALINFGKFREERLIKFESLTEALQEAMDKTEEAEMENQTLNAELKKYQTQRAIEEPEAKVLEEECRRVQGEIAPIQKEHDQLQMDIHTQKKRMKELESAKNHEKISIQELEQDCARLRSQIVQSPERMRKNIEDLGTSVHAEKSLFQETQQQFRDLQIKTDMAKKAKKSLSRALDMMEECHGEIKREKGASQEVKRVQATIASIQQEIQACRNKQQLTEQKIQGEREKINSLEGSFAPKFSAQEERKQSVLQEKNQMEQHISEKQRFLQSKQQQVRELERMIEELKATHEEEVEMVLQEFAEGKEKILQWNQDLLDLMEQENQVSQA